MDKVGARFLRWRSFFLSKFQDYGQQIVSFSLSSDMSPAISDERDAVHAEFPGEPFL